MPSSARSDAAPSASAAPRLLLRDLSIGFGSGRARREVLTLAEISLPGGSCLALTGPSGAGKSSLLHVLSGIALPGRGTIAWGDTELSSLGEGARDSWRRRHVGLVFQDFHLIDGLDALGNVLLPAWFDRFRAPAALVARARLLLERVGLPHVASRPIGTFSRGERQRIAIARALLHDPPILLADEPTASLDADTGHSVAELLLDLAQGRGATLVVATHDPVLVARLPLRWHLAAGVLDPARPP